MVEDEMEYGSPEFSRKRVERIRAVVEGTSARLARLSVEDEKRYDGMRSLHVDLLPESSYHPR